MTSLSNLGKTVMASSGGPGSSTNKDGKNAANKIVDVPIGTIFRNTETRSVIAQLLKDGDLFLAAKGGAGGKGNAYFKSSQHQTPRVAESGGFGEEFLIDVGRYQK